MKRSNIFYHYYKPGFLWFRIFGCGFAIKNYKVHGLSFSQRNGKGWKIGDYHVEYLKK